MKITAEAAVYDDDKLADDVDDAAKVATNFLTEISSDGVFVHEEGVTDPTASGANGVHISDTVKIIRDGDAVAEYGEAAVIGKADESRAYIDYHSFQMIDKDGNVYAHISDLRDDTGVATVTETLLGNGGPTYVIQGSADNVISVTVSGALRTDYTVNTNNTFVFSTNISMNAEIVIVYESSAAIYAYTFGTRDNSAYIGHGSFTDGFNNTASGFASHAEGRSTSADGLGSHSEGSGTAAKMQGAHAEGINTLARYDGSHAEGFGSQALGFYSHAEGNNSGAGNEGGHAEGINTFTGARGGHAEGIDTYAGAGDGAHAQNIGTIARTQAQTAIGKYNVDPNDMPGLSSNYAFFLGNGSSDSSRSNAMVVDWSGNLVLAGSLTSNRNVLATSGTATVNAAQTYSVCSVALARNTKYLIIGGIESNYGGSATYLANISLEGSYNSTYGITGRVTTGSGGGVSSWRYVDVGAHDCTATLQCYGYYTTSHTETGRMIAIPL